MFEIKIAFKYLLFKKRRLSSSLISLLSVLIISIVVWLILVFLSVTNGIEKNWIDKLTSLNAPIRIAPTEQYYSSYYYLIDSISAESNYTYKTIKEKFNSRISDPYEPSNDMELPYSFPKPIYDENDNFVDPVKKIINILEKEKNKNKDFNYQEYEISAALMRLSLNRTKNDYFTGFKDDKISFLTQMSYLLSLTENNPNLRSLILPPTDKDLNHLLSHMNKTYENIQSDLPSYPKKTDEKIFERKLNDFFKNISVESIVLEKGFPINLELIKLKGAVNALGLINDNRIDYLILDGSSNDFPNFIDGIVVAENDAIYFKTQQEKYELSKKTNVHLGQNIEFNAVLDKASLKKAKTLEDINLNISNNSDKKFLEGRISLKDVNLKKAKIVNFDGLPFYSFTKDGLIALPKIDDKMGVLLPKNYQNNGVLIGDFGYLSYSSMTFNSNQEIRLPIIVAGFYDPGVLPIGNKCLIVSSEITKTINSTSNTISYDGTPTNGIYVWIKDVKKAEAVKENLLKELEKEKISSFFNITTYKDYEFSKDLMQQFQSDKTLFTLIAIIILTAACSNIISMLVLLVNDKKKEIAVLRSMGASSKSIAAIFGFCGFFMGLISSIIGVGAAILTLRHLDVVIKFLSLIQGHSFFNSAFFGNRLPNDLSLDALIFVFILTPVLALIAGLIPAIKASKVNCSSTLRSQ
ncbi:MAG: FtsX-like permease family protein [Parachlamydiales bacterium]|jgi:lipoprotein-releasing system permease protein